MKISRIKNVKLPTRGTNFSAGLDFYVPYDTRYDMSLLPGKSVCIPSGIKANIPNGFALIAFNKSGVALKQGLQVGACVVDEDYQGEIHIHVTNVTDTKTTILAGQKLVQMVLVPVSYANVEEVAENELFTGPDVLESERGEGGFGSTGLN